ncbi:Uncharacterized protein dnm_056530 [Desulfonema magnum]|uniref:Uncharacterized protein n=1 Tax=Desulfonema magnum TaxID=45655 RepID=A0A975BQG4_9BACT|nr:Uncharacterized protein dnm_056530 [Desulfonema magnum]
MLCFFFFFFILFVIKIFLCVPYMWMKIIYHIFSYRSNRNHIDTKICRFLLSVKEGKDL